MTILFAWKKHEKCFFYVFKWWSTITSFRPLMLMLWPVKRGSIMVDANNVWYFIFFNHMKWLKMEPMSLISCRTDLAKSFYWSLTLSSCFINCEMHWKTKEHASIIKSPPNEDDPNQLTWLFRLEGIKSWLQSVGSSVPSSLVDFKVQMNTFGK